MPFFLVTHTSLVEADNEKDAAGKAVFDIRSGRQLTVMVKADEHTVMQVSVAADNATGSDCRNRIGCDENLVPDDQAANLLEKNSPVEELSGRRQWAGKTVVIGVFAALSILLFVLTAHGEWSS